MTLNVFVCGRFWLRTAGPTATYWTCKNAEQNGICSVFSLCLFSFFRTANELFAAEQNKLNRIPALVYNFVARPTPILSEWRGEGVGEKTKWIEKSTRGLLLWFRFSFADQSAITYAKNKMGRFEEPSATHWAVGITKTKDLGGYAHTPRTSKFTFGLCIEFYFVGIQFFSSRPSEFPFCFILVSHTCFLPSLEVRARERQIRFLARKKMKIFNFSPRSAVFGIIMELIVFFLRRDPDSEWNCFLRFEIKKRTHTNTLSCVCNYNLSAVNATQVDFLRAHPEWQKSRKMKTKQ